MMCLHQWNSSKSHRDEKRKSFSFQPFPRGHPPTGGSVNVSAAGHLWISGESAPFYPLVSITTAYHHLVHNSSSEFWSGEEYLVIYSFDLIAVHQRLFTFVMAARFMEGIRRACHESPSWPTFPWVTLLGNQSKWNHTYYCSMFMH